MNPTPQHRRVSAIAICSVALQFLSPAAGQTLDYETATKELRGYCVVNACLGMTVQDASRLGRLTWADLESVAPQGQVDCTGVFNKAVARLTTTDGTELGLAFALVSQTGSPQARYRLTSIDLKLPNVSEAQLDHLRETLTTRFSPMRETEKGFIWIGETQSGDFYISVTKLWPKPDAPVDLIEKAKSLHVSARFKKDREWLMQQRECKAGLPKV